MPTYDYACEACGHELEIFHSMSAAPKRKCPRCGKLRLVRRIGAGAGFVFKGTGFYLTDYRSSSYKEGEKAAREKESAPASGSSASEGAGKPESGASSASESKTTPEAKPPKPRAAKGEKPPSKPKPPKA